MSDQQPPEGGMQLLQGPPAPSPNQFATRERVSVTLLTAAEHMAQAAEAMQGANNSGAAKDFAAAAKDLTDAHVVLSPIVAAGEAVGQTPGQAVPVQQFPPA